MVKDKKSIKELEGYGLSYTPRTIEACLREGVTVKDLLYIPYERYVKNQSTKDAENVFYQFFEKKRKFLIKKVIQGRNKIISEEQKKIRLKSDFSLSTEMNEEIRRNKERDIIEMKKLVHFELENSPLPRENTYSTSQHDSYPVIPPRSIKSAITTPRIPKQIKNDDWQLREQKEAERIK